MRRSKATWTGAFSSSVITGWFFAVAMFRRDASPCVSVSTDFGVPGLRTIYSPSPSAVSRTPQCRDKFRNSVFDHGPNHVVIDMKIGISQAVPRPDNRMPGNVGMRPPNRAGYAGRRLVDQLQIAQNGMIGPRIADEGVLVHTVGK